MLPYNLLSKESLVKHKNQIRLSLVLRVLVSRIIFSTIVNLD